MLTPPTIAARREACWTVGLCAATEPPAVCALYIQSLVTTLPTNPGSFTCEVFSGYLARRRTKKTIVDVDVPRTGYTPASRGTGPDSWRAPRWSSSWAGKRAA